MIINTGQKNLWVCEVFFTGHSPTVRNYSKYAGRVLAPAVSLIPTGEIAGKQFILLICKTSQIYTCFDCTARRIGGGKPPPYNYVRLQNRLFIICQPACVHKDT